MLALEQTLPLYETYAVIIVDSADDALAAANATEFGLVNYVYTRGLNRALHIAENLESGMIGLNTGLVSNPAAPSPSRG